MRRTDDKHCLSLPVESGPDVPVSASRAAGSRRMLEATFWCGWQARVQCQGGAYVN